MGAGACGADRHDLNADLFELQRRRLLIDRRSLEPAAPLEHGRDHTLPEGLQGFCKAVRERAGWYKLQKATMGVQRFDARLTVECGLAAVVEQFAAIGIQDGLPDCRRQLIANE